MKQILIDYKGQRKKPRIKMLTSCTGWDEGSEYNVQYETENDNGGELYINGENGIVFVYKNEEGKEFIYTNKLK